jgi:hypothetical protein
MSTWEEEILPTKPTSAAGACGTDKIEAIRAKTIDTFFTYSPCYLLTLVVVYSKFLANLA